MFSLIVESSFALLYNSLMNKTGLPSARVMAKLMSLPM